LIPKLPAGTSFQFFPGGGKNLTNFLGGAKYEEKKLCIQKHKNHYFSKSGEGQIPPPPPPNDVPGCLYADNIVEHLLEIAIASSLQI